MGTLNDILVRLRKEERELEKQLRGIRTAISSLEFGSGGGVPRPSRKPSGVRKRGRGKLSAAQRRAIPVRMRKYRAARKRGQR
jgi:hypothetical protein